MGRAWPGRILRRNKNNLYFRFPSKRQASVFDTGFHSKMAPHAFMYAVPLAWYKEHHVRKLVHNIYQS